jgi:hypothetical protein
MNEESRMAKVAAIADAVKKAGFAEHVVVGWDKDGKWALTVNHGMTPERLKDVAAFLIKSAGD